MVDCLASTYKRSEFVDTSKVGDRAVLYHRKSGKALVLNPTGARLWELLEVTHRFSDLADRLAVEFAVAAEQTGEDVGAFLRELSEHDAIVVDQS